MAPGPRILWSIGIAALVLAGYRGVGDRSDVSDRKSAGCEAVNSGAFDLNFKVDASGLKAGLKGSTFIDGFEEGDVLTFAQKAKAGTVPFVHQLRVVAADWESNRLATVFSLDEHIVPAGKEWSETGARYAIPASGMHWSMFTASTSEGEGEYRVTVRCARNVAAENGWRMEVTELPERAPGMMERESIA
jgi:hypothetical protein